MVSNWDVEQKKIPEIIVLCDKLGFRKDSKMPPHVLRTSITTWRRSYHKRHGTEEKTLLRWKSPRAPEELKKMANAYLESEVNAIDTESKDPGSPRDKKR